MALPQPKPQPEPQSGFTLLELLVALGIVAVLMAILYETFAATLKTTEAVEEEAEIYRMARLSLSIMTEELRSALWSPDRPATIFVGLDDEQSGQPADSLRFTALSRHRYGEAAEGPELAALRYGLEPASPEEGDQPHFLLIHEEETNPLSLSAETLQRTELGERVLGLNLRYLDKEDWVDSWNAGEQKRLPRAVEIRLIFQGRQGRPYAFLTSAEVPTASDAGGAN